MEADDAADRSAYRLVLASRMLPAFGLGVMGTFLFHRWGWAVSTPVQRIVFGLAAAAVVVGLALDWIAPEPYEATDDTPAVARGAAADETETH